LATSLMLLKVMADTGAALKELSQVMERLPQKLVNVRVGDTGGLDGAEAVWEKINEASDRLGDSGRVLVRPSGTEPVIRVMVEAPTVALCDEVCDKIAAAVEETLGAA
ncbi:MAG: phosphoglucosamine mutase, partial [Actinomycetota bacterium]